MVFYWSARSPFMAGLIEYLGEDAISDIGRKKAMPLTDYSRLFLGKEREEDRAYNQRSANTRTVGLLESALKSTGREYYSFAIIEKGNGRELHNFSEAHIVLQYEKRNIIQRTFRKVMDNKGIDYADLCNRIETKGGNAGIMGYATNPSNIISIATKLRSSSKNRYGLSFGLLNLAQIVLDIDIIVLPRVEGDKLAGGTYKRRIDFTVD